MRVLCTLVMAVLIYLCSCQSTNERHSIKDQDHISDTLKTLAIDFLRSWEPPFHPDKALSLFTQTEDFYLVIDGYATTTFKEWEEGVPNYMADDNYFFKSYKHEIKDIKTVVFSPNSGVVTITYIWDNISRKDGLHKRVDGNFTIACRKEKVGWRIVHYHGSHGDERIVE